MLRIWLGIESLEVSSKRLSEEFSRQDELLKDLVSIGVDVHFKSPHMILVYSAIKGGQIRHIEAKFDDLRDLRNFTEYLRRKFNTEKVTWDGPLGTHQFLKRGLGRHKDDY
jgi:hypothetical protein